MINVEEANARNLKSVSASIPHNALTIICGPSGSGKSTFLFDVLYRAAKHQISPVLQSKKVAAAVSYRLASAVTSVTGASFPIVLGSRRRFTKHHTVSTSLGLYDLLTTIYVEQGKAHCAVCDAPLLQYKKREIVEKLSSLPDGSSVLVTVVFSDGKSPAESLADLRGRGFSRIFLDGEIYSIEDSKLDSLSIESFELAVDKMSASKISRKRIFQAVETAESFPESILCFRVLDASGGELERYTLGSVVRCDQCGNISKPITPGDFRFYNLEKSCKSCQELEESLKTNCKDCRGTKLGKKARIHSLFDTSFVDLVTSSLDDAKHFFSSNERRFSDYTSDKVLLSLWQRAHQIVSTASELGLGYLELMRPISSVSQGELQRIDLTTVLARPISGALFLLDEPSVGLHPLDVRRVENALLKLVKRRSTVIAIEHNRNLLEKADYALEFGPGGGALGGEIVLAGSFEEVGAQVLDKFETDIPSSRRERAGPATLELSSVTFRHFIDQSFSFIPKGLNVVTGVSGCGKSTLIFDLLAPMSRSLVLDGDPGANSSGILVGPWQNFDSVVSVEGKTLKPTVRSTVATLSELMTPIRELFAKSLEARMYGYSPRHFSFNSTEGQCPQCGGTGLAEGPNDSFDAPLVCSMCDGTRFNAAVNRVSLFGKSISELMGLSILEAKEVFNAIPELSEKLASLLDLGLGYLKLDQPGTELSLGERQRVYLSRFLRVRKIFTREKLFLIDEPSRGLHPKEVGLLVATFEKLVREGHTIIVVDHHPTVLANAARQLDLGEAAGPSGGKLAYQGPPKVESF